MNLSADLIISKWYHSFSKGNKICGSALKLKQNWKVSTLFIIFVFSYTAIKLCISNWNRSFCKARSLASYFHSNDSNINFCCIFSIYGTDSVYGLRTTEITVNLLSFFSCLVRCSAMSHCNLLLVVLHFECSVLLTNSQCPTVIQSFVYSQKVCQI